jgi:hypothetical protein
MQPSQNFETPKYHPHTEDTSSVESERAAQRLSQALRTEGRNADEQLYMYGLGVIEPFPGHIDFDTHIDDNHNAQFIEEAPLLGENDASTQQENISRSDVDTPEIREQNIIGVELPSTSAEELQSAIAQYYYTLPAFDNIRHRYLSQENADPAIIEERLHTICNKMKDDVFTNFKQSMLAQAEKAYNMDPATAEKYFDLRINHYTHENPLYLQDRGEEQLIIAQDFFSQDALDAVDAMILTQISATSPQSANESLKSESQMDDTVYPKIEVPKNEDPSIHASEKIDEMYDELSKITFE